VLGAGVTPAGFRESVILSVSIGTRPDVSGVSTTPNAFSTGRLLRNLVGVQRSVVIAATWIRETPDATIRPGSRSGWLILLQYRSEYMV